MVKKAKKLLFEQPKRVLGFDPGKANYAWALLVDGELKETGWVRAQQEVMDDTAYLLDMIELFEKIKPDLVIVERYQFRGRQSVYTEIVNQMIGRLSMLCKMKISQDLLQVSPSQWKNFYKVKKLDKGVWDIFPEDQDKFEAIHQVDAACIAKYGYERWYQYGRY